MTIINGVNKGIIPKGTKQLLANGTYDVELYKNAEVIVPTTAPERYLEFENDNGTLKKKNTLVYLDGITTIGKSSLTYVYYDVTFPANTNIDMSFITKIDGVYACYYAFGLTKNINSVDLSGLTTISSSISCTGMFSESDVKTVDLRSLTTIIPYTGYACEYMFGYCNSLNNVNLSSLTTITGCKSMFEMGGATLSSSTALRTLNLSSVKKISGANAAQNMFMYNTGLQNIDLSSLEVVDGNYACQNMFQMSTYPSLMTSIDLSSLVAAQGTSALNSMFLRTSLTSIDLSSLKYLSGSNICQYMFRYASSLPVLSFPALKTVSAANAFNNMLGNTTGITVHFPSNMSSYAFNPGGTNTTVLYDLPATVTLTGADTVNYERNPKYDTATALAWRVEDTGTAPDFVVDWTPFYTSGTTDPVVNDTIYSDSACTTAVTTISSIS